MSSALTGGWPSAVLFCVRRPLDHGELHTPMEDYPAACTSGVLGPVRTERCACGSLRYVAAVRVFEGDCG